MKARLIPLIAITFVLGCFRATPVSLPESLKPIPVRVTVVAPDGSTSVAIQELRAEQLIGDYSLGDGLGYNLGLELKSEGTFECVWLGCMGVYGTTSGDWSIQDSGLKLTSHKSDGMFKDRAFDRLRVIAVQEHYLLLQETDLDWFEKYGPDTFQCFHQESAQSALHEQWMRRIKRAVKSPNGASKQ